MQIIYHPLAENEMILAIKYYNSQSYGLGIKFLDDFDNTIDEIIESPNVWII